MQSHDVELTLAGDPMGENFRLFLVSQKQLNERQLQLNETQIGLATLKKKHLQAELDNLSLEKKRIEAETKKVILEQEKLQAEIKKAKAESELVAIGNNATILRLRKKLLDAQIPMEWVEYSLPLPRAP